MSLTSSDSKLAIDEKPGFSLPQLASAYPWSHKQKQQLTLESQS
jgi:hypothetical protein